jgi:di/tricarboxylate transporter
MSVDFSRHATTLVEQYRLKEGLFRLRLRATSPLIGQPPSALKEDSWAGLRLVAVNDGLTGDRLRRPTMMEGDFLLVSGQGDDAARLATEQHLAFRLENSDEDLRDSLFNRSSGLAEVMIPPRSEMIGQTAYQGMITESGDLVVIAVQRGGEDVGAEPVQLQAGDTMLLQGTWKALDTRLADPQVLVVNSPDTVRRQAVPLGAGAWTTLGVLAGMVFFLATGLLPGAVVGIAACFILILSRVVTVDQSYRAVDWTTVILVAAMMPLSTAMVQTGAAQLMADGLVAMAAGGNPIILLAGIFVLTAVLGQLISNTATALIIIPVGVAAATSMGISPIPVLMSIGIAAAAAFLTPIATPTNLMVMRPGGYAFGDYWKFGLPMMIWFFIVCVFVVPLIWPF